ncbi:MAG: ABC transporter permease [Betaproteobacteria bacterium]|nr:ABC transporter permease [Betaproteobacteria bacterium]
MGFVGWILRRLAWAAGLLLSVAVLNFSLMHMAPGDIVQTIVGEMGGASEETMAQLTKAYGLDRGFLDQLWIYVSRVAQGDLGYSYYFNRPVLGLILDRVPATVLLVFTALAVAIIAGTFLGVMSARYPASWLGALVTITALFGFSAPVFWSGLMLLLLFASVIPILPASGMYDVAQGATGIAYALDVAHHLVLPALTLAIIYLALYSRLARASMIEVLGSDYVRTARAKGLSENKVVFKHALRNAVLPVVTVAGLQFSAMLAGAVLVETVFTWPGMGQLAFESILRRDNQLILGILLLSAVLVIIGNLLTDLAYRFVDPRIRTDG